MNFSFCTSATLDFINSAPATSKIPIRTTDFSPALYASASTEKAYLLSSYQTQLAEVVDQNKNASRLLTGIILDEACLLLKPK
jgi:hypothetical protein